MRHARDIARGVGGRRKHERDEADAGDAQALAVEREEPPHSVDTRVAVHGADERVVAAKLAQVKRQRSIGGARHGRPLVDAMRHKHERLARAARIPSVEDLRNTGKIVLRGEQRLAERYAGEEEPAGRHRPLDLRERCAVDKVARLHEYAADAGTG